MLTFKVADAKRFFFDAPAVENAVDRAAKKVLSQFGSYVRRTARSSLRKRKKSSEPGQPPSSHAGLVKQFLFFVWDPSRKSVVVGPALLNKPQPETLALLEHGGTAQRKFFVVKEEPGKKKRGRPVVGSGVRFVHSEKAPATSVTYPARPFMGPALAREQPKLPAMWHNSVTG